MHDEQIIEELGEEISKGKGCIVFDFGCFFPYDNKDALTFKFKIDSKEPEEPYKYNQRYPNKGYATISQKMGRRVSKLGYPLFVDLNEHYMLLEIEVGIRERTLDLVFPVGVKLTKEKPVCALTLYFNFDRMDFDFLSCYKCEDGSGWKRTVWTNRKEEDESTIIMSEPSMEEGNYTAIYHEVLTPYPQALEDLTII